MKKFVPLASLVAILIFFTITPQSVRARSQQRDSKANQARPVPEFFFGMMSELPDRWPALPVYSVRLHDTRTGWTDLNPSNGVYNWSVLDRWIAAAEKQNAGPILYTFSQTPQWASSNPNDTTCRYGPGQCDPPNDLNADGSGSDQHWKDFVTAFATHAAGKIRYWEMWNEPANTFYWTGTQAQLVRMVKDARTIILGIDPNAKMLTPPNPYAWRPYQKFWKAYADAGGLQYADIIALHGGVGQYPPACGVYPKSEDFLKMVGDFQLFLKSYGVTKPVWDTEDNWGRTDKNCFTDPDLQSAFLAQVYLFHRSAGLRRFYWYQYYGDFGGLVDSNSSKLLTTGVAYEQIHDWMLGNSLTESCAVNGTVWTCGFTGPDGYRSAAIWDTAESCSGSVCQTVNHQVDPSYIQYRTLAGDTLAISNHQVPIGAKPILLENKTRAR